jgi:hypothetical protein
VGWVVEEGPPETHSSENWRLETERRHLVISLDFTGLTNGELGKELCASPTCIKRAAAADGRSSSISSSSLELEFGKEGWRGTRTPGAVRVIHRRPWDHSFLLFSPHGSSVPGRVDDHLPGAGRYLWSCEFSGLNHCRPSSCWKRPAGHWGTGMLLAY